MTVGQEFIERLAAALAEHTDCGITTPEFGATIRLTCGIEVSRPGPDSTDGWVQIHRTHVAAALAPLVAKEVAAAEAEALREAADETNPWLGHPLTPLGIGDWLIARADRLAAHTDGVGTVAEKCSCGNDFDGDNFCMKSACQWEGVDQPPAPRQDERCECPPCPGRGNDGHGHTHCAECCFGTLVTPDLDCPIHGQPRQDERPDCNWPKCHRSPNPCFAWCKCRCHSWRPRQDEQAAGTRFTHDDGRVCVLQRRGGWAVIVESPAFGGPAKGFCSRSHEQAGA